MKTYGSFLFFLCLLWVSAADGSPIVTSPDETTPTFELTELEDDRARCDHYDPYRQPFFGTTHLHTGLSFDSSLRFVEIEKRDGTSNNTPRKAYQFAKKEVRLVLPNIIGVQGVTAPSLVGINLPPDLRIPKTDQRLDWGGVTDHAEHFGEVGICKDFLGSPQLDSGRFSLDCRLINGFYWQPFKDGDLDPSESLATAPFNALQRTFTSSAFPISTMMNLTPVSLMTKMPVCLNHPENCDLAELAVWEEFQAAAEQEYDRTSECSFTTFNAYEAASTPYGTNWHRNVFFRNDRVVKRPITAIDMAVRSNDNPTGGGDQSIGVPPSFVGGPLPPGVIPGEAGKIITHPLPERLWNGLERDCTFGENVTDGLATHCEWLAIPHNSNLGGGVPPFIPPQWFDPFNTEDAKRKAKFEPLVEIFQAKGSSECRWDPRFRRGVDTRDEFCDFELLDSTGLDTAAGVGGSGGGGQALPPSAFNPRAFVRNVWKDGLKLADEKYDGVNPFKMGVVAASDVHNGTMGWHPENNQWPGHLGIEDAIPVARPSIIQNNSGGHSVVWAEENTRDSIFEALKRKEAYGTSGTRIVLRFFGGWTFEKDLREKDFVRIGYADGVPMGGDLCQSSNQCDRPNPLPDSKPRFIVAAWGDEHIGTPLDRIQIIKGWVDAEGQTREKVFDLKRTSRRGREFLFAVWEDRRFNPQERAFYYARVLEKPVPRYSTVWCQVAFGLDPLRPGECRRNLRNLQQSSDVTDQLAGNFGASCCSNERTDTYVQPKIQERAWSSPIWYTPGE